MKEQGRPTLTLRRKAAPEGQDGGNEGGEERQAGTVSVRRRKTVVVNAAPARREKPQVADEKALQAQDKAARKAERARQWAEEQTRVRAALKAERHRPAPEPVYRKVMPPDDALALLKGCWPALVVEGKPQLLAVGIREAMLADIRERGLGISGKALKRCLSAITRSEVYLNAMTAGAWRKNLAGEPVAQVGVDDAAFAAKRKAQESRKRQRRATRENTACGVTS